jgi:hypothetical protein
LTTMFRMMLPMPATGVHHQYSLRVARPVNVAYFLKNCLTATGNGAPYYGAHSSGSPAVSW